MNFVEKNQDILNRWKAQFCLDKSKDPDYKDCDPTDYFAEDGIMYKGEFEQDKEGKWSRNPSTNGIKENELWSNAPLRVLFLTKDENLFDYSIAVWDVRGETFHAENSTIEDYKISNSFFYKNEANILYGILHTTPECMIGFDEFSVKDAIAFSDDLIFARINCKKEGGGGSLENEDLRDAIKKDKEYLKEQILALDADIFICCGSQGDNNLILDLIKEIYYKEFEYCDYGTGKGTAAHFNEKRNKLALDIYHLAYSRNGGEIARYYEAVGAYYQFIKRFPTFAESHR